MNSPKAVDSCQLNLSVQLIKMKDPLILLQVLYIFLSRFDTTESRYLDATTEATTQTPTRITLPQGYSITPGDNVAYKLYTDYKAWDEARDRCISDGGHLANVDSLEKRDHIRNRFSGVSEWVHCGLRKQPGTQNWISIDTGLPATTISWFAYTEEDSGYNCGTIWASDGRSTNWLCTTLGKSLCEIRIGENRTVDETELQTTDATTEATTQTPARITLPEGYLMSPGDNVAYKLYTEEKTWYDARDRCISDGGHLAAIDTLEKRDHIRKRFSGVSGWVHVGLHNPAGTPHWISSDTGLPVTSIPWHSYTAGESNYNCVAMYPADGDLTNWPCENPRKSLCEIRIEATAEAATQVLPGVTLPAGYLMNPGDNVAYKLYSDGKTWADARDRCILDGGHLAIADTTVKRNHIRNSFPGVENWVHIGIYRPAIGQEWIRVDNGLPVTSIAWYTYHEEDDNNCGAIWPEDADLTNWPCTRLSKSLCEIRIGGNKTVGKRDVEITDDTTTEETTEATTQVLPGITLLQEYVLYPGDNVTYKLYTDEKSWYEARDRCVSDGGHLANVDGLEKRNDIRKRIPKVSEWVHCGLHKPPGAQHWINIDTGLPATSISWYSYNEGDSDNCGSIWPSDGDLNNWLCERHSKSLCEIRISENRTVDETELQTTLPATTKDATT